MRVAALYDIHGNLPALEAVLEDIRQAAVDHVVVGGDVLPGPMPRETLTRLLELDLPVQFIHGNGDRVVVAQMAGNDVSEVPEQHREVIRWTAQQLRAEHERTLAGGSLRSAPSLRSRHAQTVRAGRIELIPSSNGIIDIGEITPQGEP